MEGGEDEGKLLEGENLVNTPKRGENLINTPKRGRITTPVSRFEDSPVFNYINNLSPLETARPIRISQSFNSYNLSSVPSVFTSPHVSSLKGSQLLRRHSFPAPSFPACSSENGIKIVADKSEEQKASADPARHANETGNGGEAAEEAPENQDYLCHEPNNSMVTCPDSITKCVQSELGENSGFDCENFYDAADFLVFESPNNANSLNGYFLKALDSDTRLHLPGTQNDDSVGVEINEIENAIIETGEGALNSIEAAEDIPDLTSFDTQAAEDVPDLTSLENQAAEDVPDLTSFDNQAAEVSTEVNADELTSNLPRGMKRRCLVFEGGARRKFLNDNSSSSSSMSANGRVTSSGNQSIPRKPENKFSKCILPGIGLHLNALARPSKDYKTNNNQETLENDHSMDVAPDSFANNQEEMNQSLPLNSTNDDVGPLDGGVYVTEDLGQNSAKKKRKMENGELDGCKRCNCKKSKCLKLYCECFAAGVYCVEPCSCQDCFNKPIHEETVLATRKQIESRNPLAFAPKVIRTIIDAVPETVDELSNTPASARHKRGCNCKKSGCLKKYCECYQGGVGCSMNCRCESCKNVFGRKEGLQIVVTDSEVGEMDLQEKSAVDKNLSKIIPQKDAEPNPETPMLPNRVPVHHKPPRAFSMATSSAALYGGQKFGIPAFLKPHSKLEKRVQNYNTMENEIPEVLRSPTTGIKSSSPNSKRVSPPHCNPQSSFSPIRTTTSRKLILQSIPSFPSLKD